VQALRAGSQPLLMVIDGSPIIGQISIMNEALACKGGLGKCVDFQFWAGKYIFDTPKCLFSWGFAPSQRAGTLSPSFALSPPLIPLSLDRLVPSGRAQSYA